MKIVKTIILGVAATILLSACSSDTVKQEQSQKIDPNIPIKYSESLSAINTDDYSEVVGFYDYVFCGTVKEVVETTYIETEGGPGDEQKTYYDPVTVYRVEVLENIKGNLEKNCDVLVYKNGGLTKEGDAYILREGDTFPEVEKTYIFNAWVKTNGTLGIAGEVSNIYVCESTDEKNVKNYDIYKEFVKAYQNEKVYDRERYTFEESE